MDILLSILNITGDKDTFIKKIHTLEEAGIQTFHIDVTDGRFAGVDNVDEMYKKASILRDVSIMQKEVHLMTYDIYKNIDLFAFIEPTTIYVHIEAIKKEGLCPIEVVKYIREYDIQVGMVLNPETQLEELNEVLPYLDKIIIMTVNPGYGKQKFMQEIVPKIYNIRNRLRELDFDIELILDGGINDKTIMIANTLEIDKVVVGSYIVSSNQYARRIQKLKRRIDMLTNTKEMLLKAKENNYAVGAFNFTNLESLQAIVEAAEEEKSPVIIQTSSSAIKYMGMEYIMQMVEAATVNSTVPIALHLDHGASFEIAKECIDNGYTSVMIDMSSKPYEENVRETKRVVEYAHERGVTVEAEIGTLAGVEDEVSVDSENAIYTDPKQAKEFADATGVDSLAIAIGTSHGAYKFKGDAKLRFDILEEVTKLLPNTPIVLHGASTVIKELVDECNKYGGEIPGAKGCPDEMLKEASKRGVSKINVDTDLRLAFTSQIRKFLAEKPSSFNQRDYLEAGKEKAKEIVKHKMKNVFMSSNMAMEE